MTELVTQMSKFIVNQIPMLFAEAVNQTQVCLVC